ncbi:MAG: glycosyltransferase [Erysipelotrichaceae bacterium]|jgi:cellulose synthase/poly-beta-1,6-N-acetylglucosamine synthase-like glycosyltransferase|nr:glycosyltransferase [Erysipelotrichaceae bacterium]
MEILEIIKDYLLNLFGLNLILKDNPTSYELTQGYLNLIFMSITVFLGLLAAYKAIYLIMGIVAKSRTYTPKDKNNRYAFVVSARNEENVIPNLIKSIMAQDYPSELIDIIVVADNCDDNTAEIARNLGCIVYERHDLTKVRKGYALQWLFDKLKEENKILTYDGFSIIDADNVVALDYMSKMNDAFQDGYDVVTSYRNIKNFKDNVISSAFGLNWLRFVISNHRPRSILKCPTNINGTGFLIRSELLKDGWSYVGLTEDAEMTTKLVTQGKKIIYCEAAQIYDEQPTTFKISTRQRIRWSRGCLDNYYINSWALLWSFIKKPSWAKYDMYFEIFPFALVSFILTFIYQVISITLLFLSNGDGWSNIVNYLVTSLSGLYFGSLFTGIVIVVKEWKRIHVSVGQAIWYLLCWPWFDILGVPISIISLFIKVKWKPIPHSDLTDIHELTKEEIDKNKN